MTTEKDEEKEICVCGCGKKTSVNKNTPIGERACYIEGVGQLHPKCYQEIVLKQV